MAHSQGLCKYLTVYFYHNNMHQIIQNMHNVYKAFTDCGTVNYRSVQWYTKIELRVVQFGTIISFGSCMFFVPYTLFENWRTGQREPVLHAFIPFVDETTTGGYAISFTIHCGILLFFAVGIIASDLVPLLGSIHSNAMAKIIANMFDEMNAALVKLPANRRDSAELRRFIRNIIMVHSEFCDHYSQYAHCFRPFIFIEVYSDALSLCLIQVALVKVNIYLHDWLVK